MRSDIPSRSSWLRCLFILFSVFLLTSLELYYLEPLASMPFLMPGLRSPALLGAVVVYGAVAICASFRPDLIRPRFFTGCALALFGLGAASCWAASLWGRPILGVLGGIAVNAATAWVRVFACLCLVDLTRRACVTCAGTAMLLFFGARYVISPLGEVFGLVIFAILTAALGAVSFKRSEQLFETQMRVAVVPATSTAVEPKTFLPFSHRLFLTLFVFSIACGFTVTFSLGEITPTSTVSAVVLVALPVAYLVLKPAAHMDVVYQFSALYICAGLVSMMLPTMAGTVLPNVLLAAGSNTFKLLAYCVLAIVAQRNPINALAMLAWGEGIITAAMVLGMALGDLLTGLASIGSGYVFVLIALMAFGFFAYNVCALHLFSLDAVLQGIVHPSVIMASVREAALGQVDDREARLESISRKCGLTPREAEIFALLAKGRNVPYIETELVISQNTIRSHIKHIYQKAGVHSQQELINLLEEG